MTEPCDVGHPVAQRPSVVVEGQPANGAYHGMVSPDEE